MRQSYVAGVRWSSLVVDAGRSWKCIGADGTLYVSYVGRHAKPTVLTRNGCVRVHVWRWIASFARGRFISVTRNGLQHIYYSITEVILRWRGSFVSMVKWGSKDLLQISKSIFIDATVKSVEQEKWKIRNSVYSQLKWNREREMSLTRIRTVRTNRDTFLSNHKYRTKYLWIHAIYLTPLNVY